MAKIQIAADGSTSPMHVKHGNQVSWQATPRADGTFPQWYIIFPSPFKEDFITTDPDTGLTDSFKVRKTVGSYMYMVSSVDDPTLAETKKVRIFIPGGGIIIDS